MVLAKIMEQKGPESARYQRFPALIAATDQKARGSNPLGRARKSAETVCFCGFSYFFGVFKRFPFSLIQAVTHTGISPDSTG